MERSARIVPLIAISILCAGTAWSAPDASPRERCALPLIQQYVKMPPVRVAASKGPARAQAAPAAQRELWTWDLSVMPPGFRRVPATLRARGPHCLVYVEDAEWGRTVDQAAADKVLETFENSTPGSAGRGIVAIDTDSFGEMPAGLDGETRVTILFARLGRFHGQGFDGFFNAFDTYPENEAWTAFQQHSNETNIIYLNTDGSAPSSDYMLAVVAHELVHLLAHPHDPDQVSWIAESLGEAGMLLCGYDTDQAHAHRYASHPSTPLVTEPYVSYGACLYFAADLIEHQPRGFLKRLVDERTRGVEAVERVLGSYGSNDGFPGLFERWAATNYAAGAGSPSPDFAYSSMKPPVMTATAVAGATDLSGTMQATGIKYLRFDAPGAYELRVASRGPAPMQALLLESPAGARPVVKPLDLSATVKLDVSAGDCVALYGLTRGVYPYEAHVRPAGNR